MPFFFVSHSVVIIIIIAWRSFRPFRHRAFPAPTRREGKADVRVR